ncbi:hypothetical protein D3C77_629300 [compost metagenome]
MGNVGLLRFADNRRAGVLAQLLMVIAGVGLLLREGHCRADAAGQAQHHGDGNGGG